MNAAPVILFLGTRPERATAVLDSLSRAEGAAESLLTIFCDAPRNPTEAAGAAAVRVLARDARGFRNIEVLETPAHGGSRQVLSGVSAMLRVHDRVIVVEDDLVVSSVFLLFMNDALEKYAGDPRVASVCGSSFSLQGDLPEAFFLPGAHCWGWATWRRSWTPLPFDPARLLRELLDRDLVHAFDAGGAEPLTQALQDAILDGDTPWSLCWMASAILSGRLTLYPGRPLAVNVDARGPAVAPAFDTSLSRDRVRIGEPPVATNEDVLRKLRSALVKWRCSRSRSFHAYALIAGLLPSSLEKQVYSSLIRRKLRQNARRRGSAHLVSSGGVC